MASEAIFRSAPMALAQLYVSKEVSSEVVRALGELGSVQFRDLNKNVSSFQRAFVSDIRRLDDALRQVRLVKKTMDEVGIDAGPAWQGHTADVDNAITVLARLESQLTDLISNKDKLQARQASLTEHRHVVHAANRFFGTNETSRTQSAAANAIQVLAGVIDEASVGVLERILWRALRGNLVFSFSPVEEPLYAEKQHKHVKKAIFILVTYGHESSVRAKKIADALDAHSFQITSNEEDRANKLNELNTQIEDISLVLKSTNQAIEAELRAVQDDVEVWENSLDKEKAVYESLNLFIYDQGRKLLIGEGWLPKDEIARVQATLRRVSEANSVESPCVLSILETNLIPPTFHRTTKVTAGFQAMVDVYAVATYREVNPGLPTVVTFPFIFAIMFGDMGHGFLLFLAALGLVIYERKLAPIASSNDIFEMAYSGRYILLLMGLFSIYTGLLYNDLFSKSMTLFQSGWEWPEPKPGQTLTAQCVGVYPFGIDSAWHGAENSLLFLNSYKMKLSILMGWAHMSYSYMFSLVNAIYFGNPIDIWGNFLPGLLFFQGIFGYLSVTIIYKWFQDWTGRAAPSLLNLLINMFLSPGKIDIPLYPGQKQVQVFLLLVALISVPWLLLLKPLYLRRKLQQKQGYESVEGEPLLQDVEHGQPPSTSGPEVADDDEEGEHSEAFGDIMIHQVIHTIEFCLNCVSHTASYLRLWALSLAHAQLSSVLWDMTISIAFGFDGVLGVFMTVVLFAMWFLLTCAVLVVMEGTSAMLHALRLHWVESMSKFYIGEGKPFEPFSFSRVRSSE